MNRTAKTLTLLLAAAPLLLSAEPKMLELTLGKSAAEHRIDGKLSSDEVKNGFRMQGATSEISKAWSKRQVTFYLARTQGNLILFIQSPMPPGDMKLHATDEAVFLVTAPDGKKIQLKCTPSGFQGLSDGVEGKSDTAGGNWSVEVSLPAALFGLKEFDRSGDWTIQLERNYRNPTEKTYLAENGALVRFADAPFVDFHPGKGADIDGSLPTLFWQVSNPPGKERLLDFAMESSWDGAPRALSQTKKIPAGGSGTFSFVMNDFWQGEKRSCFSVLRDGKVQFFRYSGFFGGRGVFWLDSSRKFDIGVYPSLGKIKARIFSFDTRVMDKIALAAFTITDRDGRELSRQNVERSRSGFYKVWDLPDGMSDGFFKLNAVLTMKDGKTETLSREFEYRKYPWVNNQIGLERDIIVPPFKPLVYDREKNSVHALLTGYRFGKDIFSEVYAEGENILAEPIRLFINSRRITFGKIKLTEVAKDRVQAGAVAENDPNWSIHYDFDYDGLVWISIRYAGKDPLKLEQMSLEIPLAEKYAKLYQSTCGYIRRNPSGFIPAGKGRVWNSLTNAPSNSMAYIWIGETKKGLAWFRESLSNWNAAPGTPHHEIIRKDGQVILKNTIVSEPIELPAGSAYEMGFQASPVKPRMKNWRKYQLVNDVAGWTIPKSVPRGLLSSCLMWSGAGANTSVSVYSAWEPWNGDYSFVRYLKTLYGSEETRDDVGLTVKNFVDRNVPDAAKKVTTIHMRHGALVQAMNSKLTLFYFNPRSASFDQPEFRVFEDEWNNRTFRTGRDGWYSFNPFPSYRDFIAVKIRELARNGMDGVYFDNSYEAGHADPVMGDCLETIPGVFQNQFTFMDLRRLVKRTATILYKEGKLIEGRPYVMVHVTNSSMLPVTAFASHILDWEMFFGKRTFQDRFPEGYVLAGSLGTQSGCAPAVLLNTKGGDRKKLLDSALGVLFGYDLADFLLHGAPDKWFQDVLARTRYLGYADDRAVVYPGYLPEENPVKILKGQVKITTVKYEDHALLLVGDFGNGGQVSVDLSALKMPKAAAVDAVTGESLGNGSLLSFGIGKHSYRVVLIGKDPEAIRALYGKMLSDCKRSAVKPPVRNVEIKEGTVRGKRAFFYLAENALTGKTREMVTEVDGKKVFCLKKDHGITFTLPDDLDSLAGKTLEISYRYRIRGIPSGIQEANGFKVMLVHSAKGKNFYGHTRPETKDNAEWKRAVFGARLGKDLDGGSLRVNAPAEEILLESIVLKILD